MPSASLGILPIKSTPQAKGGRFMLFRDSLMGAIKPNSATLPTARALVLTS